MKSIMNTDEERHAWFMGFCEMACPWPARYRVTNKSEYGTAKEHHYYLWGRTIGLVYDVLLAYGSYRLFTW